jgi:enoyl-CoA hydratase/carnithine racemase
VSCAAGRFRDAPPARYGPRPAQEDIGMSAAKNIDGAAPLLLREDGADGVSVLTLNRPAARNSLSLQMLNTLEAVLVAIGQDAQVRCVVLAAAGPVFCAGHDLKEITAHRTDADGGRGFYDQAMSTCARVMQAIVALPQPVIAAVQGVATAAGCQLVATCDLAVASDHARFATPGVDIGLFCSTPAVALARAVPRKAAMEMLLTGEMVDAAEAHRIGLLNRVVPHGREMEAALTLARGIAARSALTVRLGKRAFYAQVEQPLAEAYRAAACVMTDNLMAHDAAEGIGAFVGKRRPVWEDR